MDLSTKAHQSTNKATGSSSKSSLFRSPVEELKFLQATGNYSWLHWKNGQKVLMSRTLTYYQLQLPEGCFIRLHRNCIVNLQHVERFELVEANKSGQIYLYSGEILPVSRRRLSMVKRLVLRHLASSTSMA